MTEATTQSTWDSISSGLSDAYNSVVLPAIEVVSSTVESTYESVSRMSSDFSAANKKVSDNPIIENLGMSNTDYVKFMVKGEAQIMNMFEREGATKTLEAIKAGLTNPDQISLINEINTNPEYAEFKKAFHKALYKDETVYKGLSEMGQESTTTSDFNNLSDMLKNPKSRAWMTKAMNFMADQDDVTFKQMKDLFEARRQYDPLKMEESDARIKKSLTGLGLPDGQADEIIATSKKEEMLKNISAIFKDPEGMLGKLGNFLQGIGLPPQMAQAITGIFSYIGRGISQVPELASNFWNSDANQGLRDYKQKWLDSAGRATIYEGRRLIDGVEVKGDQSETAPDPATGRPVPITPS